MCLGRLLSLFLALHKGRQENRPGLLEMHAAHRQEEAEGVLPPHENCMHRSEKLKGFSEGLERTQEGLANQKSQARSMRETPAGGQGVLITAQCVKQR